MTSITQPDGTIISVAEGSWASVESPLDPTKERFMELGKLSAEKRQQMNDWLAKVAAVASAFPLGFSLFFLDRV